MFNTLFELLGVSDLESFQNRLLLGAKRLSELLGGEYSTLEETDGGYEIHIPIAPDATAKNATVDYDEDTRVLEVSYRYDNDGYKSFTLVKETLPDDADDTTIDAVAQDGELLITVEKFPEPVEDEVKDEGTEDEVNVRVNRKRK